jgi:hypothetical protein
MNKKFYLLTLIIGFFLVVDLLQSHQVSLAQAAWFFWSANFLFLPLWFILASTEYLITGKKYHTKSSSSSALNSPIRFFVMSILTVLMGGLFHVVAGLFLSILQPVEPYTLFRVEGFNQNFDLNLILYHIKNFSFLIPGFLALKMTLLFVEPGLRLTGHSCLRDGIFPLIAAFVIGFVFRDLSPSESVVLFSGFLFLPWTLIFGKDRFAKIATSEPELQIPLQVPVQHTYRPQVSPFWGIVFLLSGLFIGVFIFHMTQKIVQAGQAPWIAVLLMGLIGWTVGSGFIFVGMNMLFSSRQVHLTISQVSVVEKAFLIVIPRIRKWSCQMSDYSSVDALAKSGVSSNAKSVFVIQLTHRLDKAKNVELYRAYHSDDYKIMADQWRQLLGFK